eukprot:COSAG03_NODE_7456_length_916_cov_0.630355_2_plen_33_part_01
MTWSRDCLVGLNEGVEDFATRQKHRYENLQVLC